MPILSVYINHQLAGHITPHPPNQLIWQYATDWLDSNAATALSYSLPLQKEAFSAQRSTNFFNHLLPHGQLRRRISRRLHLDESDTYALLKEIGGECPGNITITTKDAPVPSKKGRYTPISEQQLPTLFARLQQYPLMAGNNDHQGIRMTLSGAQNKLPLYIDNSGVYLPKGTAASSHILKPPVQYFPHSTINGAYCLTLAHLCDLPVPEVTVVRNANHPYFLIRRYDRQICSENGVTRIHQEDFCQALGIENQHRYEQDGGPSLRDCFQLIDDTCSAPAKDRLALLKWVLFNFLIQNTQANAKNLALLYQGDNVSLAPFIKLHSSGVYGELSETMRLSIGGEVHPHDITADHWQQFADDCGLKITLIKAVRDELCANLLNQRKLARELVTINQDEGNFIALIDRLISARMFLLERIP